VEPTGAPETKAVDASRFALIVVSGNPLWPCRWFCQTLASLILDIDCPGNIHQFDGTTMGIETHGILAAAIPSLMVVLGWVHADAAGPLKSFRPGAIWPDNNGVQINAHGGGILVHEGTCYWFGQHMVEGDAGNYAQVGVHVYSSQDLYNWRDQGIALRVSEDPASDITKGCILERPKVIYNRTTSKFVMWFHLELKSRGYAAARSGIAVADQPTGPYRFIESFRPNARHWPINVPAELKKPLSSEEEVHVRKLNLGGGPVPNFPENLLFRRDFAGGQMARDMTLFVEDDGTAFHIYASEDNGTLHISQLTEDYLKPAGKYIRVFPGGFNEAPAVLNHAGSYYLFTSGCTGLGPQCGAAGCG